MSLSNTNPPKGMVECDSCGGMGVDGQDEDGKWFSCYRCGESGWMPEACRWETPQVLAANVNRQQHFLARYPRPIPQDAYPNDPYDATPCGSCGGMSELLDRGDWARCTQCQGTGIRLLGERLPRHQPFPRATATKAVSSGLDDLDEVPF